MRPGTHINAFGSDTPHKQELAVGILACAARVPVVHWIELLDQGDACRQE